MLWLGVVFLTRKRKWISMAVLTLGLVLAVFVILPGRELDMQCLQDTYVRRLQRYTGTRYVWGGENGLGIDCSGLVLRALINANIEIGLTTLNPRALRYAFSLWWHDCTARALRDQYRNFTIPIFTEQSINSINRHLIMPGDIAVTANGIHVLAYIGNSRWIEADPDIMEVIELSVPTKNKWFTVPVNVMRWTQMK